MRLIILACCLLISHGYAAGSDNQYQLLIQRLDAIIAAQQVPSYSLSIVAADKNLLLHTAGLSDRKRHRQATILHWRYGKLYQGGRLRIY